MDMINIRSWAMALALALVTAGAAAAQDGGEGPSFGIRGGLGINPDVVLVGAHANFNVGSIEALSIEPSAMIGFGDFNTLQLAGLGRYDVEVEGTLAPYALGGLGLIRWTYDGLGSEFIDGSFTELGLILGGGLDFGRLGVEAHLGIGNIGDIQIIGRLDL